MYHKSHPICESSCIIDARPSLTPDLLDSRAQQPQTFITIIVSGGIRRHAYLAHLLIWKLLSLAYLMAHLMTTIYIGLASQVTRSTQRLYIYIYMYIASSTQSTPWVVLGLGPRLGPGLVPYMLWIGTGMEFSVIIATLLHHRKNSVI